MPRDTEEALRRLEQALDEEYETEQEEDDEEADIVLAGGDVNIYNSDHTDVDAEEYDEIFEERRSGGNGGLVALALVLMTAIALMLLFFALKFKGLL